MLVILIAAIYSPVRDFQFLKYDDIGYIQDNDHVQQGLTSETIRWAMVTAEASNWHPLTWLSHMLDIEWFGNWAGGHHLTNVVFHAVNAALLLLVLWRMTGCVWRSACVAALFAFHPLAVESVAWISERKNVLSTFFWLLIMLTYTSYAQRRTVGRYAAVCILLALGLMSKSMLVTLPFVLLLLDVWPLGRAGRESWRRLVMEKLPLLAMSIATGVITLMVQGQEAVQSTSEWTFDLRAGNAAVAYVRYMGKMFWPTDLLIFYPFPHEYGPGRWAVWMVAGSLLLLISMTMIALRYAHTRRYRYLIVGWLWFLGTLVPVNGLLVQHASQSMADRYTYIPLIGLFIALVWGATDIARRFRHGLIIAGAMAVAAILALMVCTSRQLPVWQDTYSLFKHTSDADPDNWLTNYGMAVHFERQKDYEKYYAYLSRILRVPIFGRHGRKYTYDAIGLLSQTPMGMNVLYRAMVDRPDEPRAHLHFGIALALIGRNQLAHFHITKALELDPSNAHALVALGHVLESAGRHDQAVKAYRDCLVIDPVNPDAHLGLALSMKQAGRMDEARYHRDKVAEYDPRLLPKLESLFKDDPASTP